jgi:hypothetical protein
LDLIKVPHWLKSHPFAVAAHFDYSLVLTYALPQQRLQKLLPPCLQPDTFEDHWGFVAVAMVQSRQLRPKGFPAWLGNDFFLIGYRIFVRYQNQAGKRLRGLYILRSETDKRQMELTGNFFTHYNYNKTDIQQQLGAEEWWISSQQSNFKVGVRPNKEDCPLPEGSVFNDWKTARRYAGPLPFTFMYQSDRQEVLIVEGVRQNWQPKPVEVIDHQIGFFPAWGLHDAQLANAFIIRDIPYYWKKGKIEAWKA